MENEPDDSPLNPGGIDDLSLNDQADVPPRPARLLLWTFI